MSTSPQRTTLVYLSPVPLGSFRQRPHYMVHALLESCVNEVLWLEPYPTRIPNPGDLKRPDEATVFKPDLPSIRQVKVPALPVEPLPLGARLNRGLFWNALLSEIESAIQGRRVILGIGKPSSLALLCLDELDSALSFYDAMDDFPAFYSGLSRRSMARYEKAVVDKVQHVIASSTSLYDKFEGTGVSTQLVNNAYDMDTVRAEREPEPARMVAGYIGTVGHWFDWNLLVQTAERTPEADFEIVGPVYNHHNGLLPENVSLLPACSQQEAWQHLSRFDVGLIPFRRVEITAGVDPIKYYEYRAYGLPVLSTKFGEMNKRGTEAGVFLVENADEAAAILQSRPSIATDATTADFRRINDWHERFEPLVAWCQA